MKKTSEEKEADYLKNKNRKRKQREDQTPDEKLNEKIKLKDRNTKTE